ncbi:MAG: TIM barrel protein [Fulvivirga sp.]
MSINRRTFLSQSALLSGSFFIKPATGGFGYKKTEKSQNDFSLTLLATNWGFKGTWDEFCKKTKETGYDGIEVWLPGEKKEQENLFEAIEKHKLKYAFMAAGASDNLEDHLSQFRKSVEDAVAYKPLFVNCHSGKDYFTFEQNKKLIDFTTALSDSSGVKIYHETHRQRMLFAAHITADFIKSIPDLRLTLDISHWCNVHESLLQDQQKAVELTLERTDHIHARIGHAEGPQVTDPRAPEWKKEVEAHFQWWDKVVQHKMDKNQPLTMTAEFGPPNYMTTVPYTLKPLADLWEINTHMMRLWKERYL